MTTTDIAAARTAAEIQAELTAIASEIARVRAELRQEGFGPTKSMLDLGDRSLQLFRRRGELQQELAGLEQPTAV